jgi:phosphoglycerate dehydrogenase-like enzyme
MDRTSIASLLLLVTASCAFADQKPAADHEASLALPVGVAVTVERATERNAVWIDIAGDVLAVDAPSSNVSGERSARYALSTAADDRTVPSDAVLVWPASRAGHATAAGRPTMVVPSGFALGSGGRRAVVLDLGRRASAADAVVWLPEERLLVTGNLCTRGRIQASGQSDTAAWLEALSRLQDLEPLHVVPGTGAPGGAELIEDQISRLRELRELAKNALLRGLSPSDLASAIESPWFATWREQDPAAARAAVGAVYREVGGLRTPWVLLEDRDLREGPSLTRDNPSWTRPDKVLWRNSWPERLAMLSAVAPGVEIVPYETREDALQAVAGADALIGTASRELLEAGTDLRWVQVGSAGVERYLEIPQLASGAVILTNGQRLASEVIGEHVMALTRALARGLNRAVGAQLAGQWQRSEIGDNAPLTKLRGKTLLVVGLGGIGTEVARLADGAGMRVTAIRNSRRSGPDFVDRVGLGEDLPAYMAEADVVVNCLPLTDDTRGIFDAELFARMKSSAFFINVGRGGTVVTADLMAALESGVIAGAGLDVTDPEPLPEGHPLWKAPNLIITPHFAAWSDEDPELRWLLYRENLRRFAAGEPLLSVVDPEAGY